MDFTKLVLCLIILGGVALVCFADRKSVKNFDERQLLYRGRAVTIAFASLLLCLFVVLLLNTMNLAWFDLSIAVILSMVISLTIFAVYAILHDAYFTHLKKQVPFSALFLVVALANVFNGIRHAFGGSAESVYDIVLPVVIGVLGLIICATLLIKRRMDKKESDEE